MSGLLLWFKIAPVLLPLLQSPLAASLSLQTPVRPILQQQNEIQNMRNQASTTSDWSSEFGESALLQVQSLASKVATATDQAQVTGGTIRDAGRMQGVGGRVMREVAAVSPKEKTVWSALENLERDSE